MSHSIMESDWKQFKEIHSIALGRFAQRCLEQVQYHLTDKVKPPADRFFDICDAVRTREKDCRRLFDDYRRSTAVMQIMMMRAEKLITDDEMNTFSTELREHVERILRPRD